MNAKELIKKLCCNYINIEGCDMVTIDKVAPVSGYFPIADECDVEDGEYFYTYLDDEDEMKSTEKFLGQPFDYAFPLRDSDGWVGLISMVED